LLFYNFTLLLSKSGANAWQQAKQQGFLKDVHTYGGFSFADGNLNNFGVTKHLLKIKCLSLRRINQV